MTKENAIKSNDITTDIWNELLLKVFVSDS